jgi:hypothetical protein
MPDLPPEGGSVARLRGLLTGIKPGTAAVVGITAAILAFVLLAPANLVIGAAYTDLVQQFLAWRAFAAQSLLAGHLPLWNPYTYSGQPFLGGFQSALLYPPNAVFLFLPQARAANLSFLMHLAILGWGMHRIATRRGLHPAAAWTCALLFPMSGAVFPHLYAGHLPNICSMAWTPWVFAGLEECARGRRVHGILLASAAVALQILAGHVQYVFYTGIAAGLFALAHAAEGRGRDWRALYATAFVYAAAILLAAAQLFPGIANIRQGIRQARLDFGFAGMFSLPVENLLTFVSPGFLGDLAGHPYWGRGYLWEMSVFVGISGLLLALGRHTPLYGLLYDTVPGIDRFRGMSKFTFPALLFLVLAIGRGVDALARRADTPPIVALAAIQAGITAFLGGLALRFHPGLLSGFLDLVRDSGESYLPARAFSDPVFVTVTGLHAGSCLIGTSVVLLAAGWLLVSSRTRPVLRWGLPALLAVEMAVFAGDHFATADAGAVLPKGLAAFVASKPGDYRVLNAAGNNNGFFLGKPDIWGDDPQPLSRYAQFITFTQGGNPDETNQNIVFTRFPALYSMLRLRYIFIPGPGGVRVAEQTVKPMEVAQLVSDYRVIPGRNALFDAMARPGFDPRKTALLEGEPYPRPVPSPDPGSVRILESTPNTLALEAEVKMPALLLITDLYSVNWRASPIGESAQALYEIMPADYILKAIPLSAGRHHILVEYVPGGFRLGIGVSVVAWLGWFALAFRPRPGGLARS